MANKVKTSTKTFLFDPNGNTDVFDTEVSAYMQAVYDENEYTRVTVVAIEGGIMLFTEMPDAKGTIEGRELREKINPNNIAIGDTIEIDDEPAAVLAMDGATGQLLVGFKGGDKVAKKTINKAKKIFAEDYKPVRHRD